jgi:hypothetical protein
MKKQGLLFGLTILLAALLLASALPMDVHAADPAYSVCSVCYGTGICGNCNPNNTLDTNMPAADKLGDGWIACHDCDANGYRRCGTNHAGDGTPIGCDGSGKVECVRCHGSGVDNGNACPDCEGTGKMNCEICGGLGKYLCDSCGGTHRMACRCRQAGHVGKCPQCGGSGWTLIDYEGNVLEYGAVHYPKQGDVIDYGIRRRGTGSYNAEKYGTGINPSQYVDKMNGGTGVNGIGYLSINNPTPVADLTGGEATQQIIANGGHVGGGGNSSGGGNSGGGSSGGQQGNSGQSGNSGGNNNQNPNPGPDNNQQGGEPNPGPEPGPGPNDDPDGNPYTQDIPDDQSIVAALGDDKVEMVYLLNREVDGRYLLTVQINKPGLTAEEKAKLKAMTEADVRALKDDLESLANYFRFTETGDPTFFDFGSEYRLPVTCDILLELPADAANDSERPLHLYRVTENGWEKERNHTVDHYENTRYLIFTYDTLGRFAHTTMSEEDIRGNDTTVVDWNGDPIPDPNGGGGNPGGDSQGNPGNDSNPGGNDPNPGDGNDHGNDSQGSGSNPGGDPNPGNDNPNSDPGNDPKPADDTAKKAFPVLPVAAGAVAVAVIAVFAARAKKKNR